MPSFRTLGKACLGAAAVASLVATAILPTNAHAADQLPKDVLLSGTYAKPANITVYGDSISFGAGTYGNTNPKFNNSWPGQLRYQLTKNYGNAGTGFVIANSAVRANPAYDPRWTFTGPTITDAAQGFHKAGVYEVAAGSSLSFKATASNTEFVAYLLGSGSSVAQVQVDSGAVKTIQASATGAAPSIAPQSGFPTNHYVTAIPAGAMAQHTLKITAVGGSVKLFGIEARTGAGSIRVNNASISGKALSSLGANATYNDATNNTFGLAMVDTTLRQGPSVAVVALAVNDWQAGASTATLTTYLNTVINRARANGATPVLYLPPQPSTVLQKAGGPTYTQYANTFKAVSAATGVPFLNHQKIYAPTQTDEQSIYNAGKALGMYADTVHPTDKGSYYMVAGYGSTPGIKGFLGLS